MCPRLFVWNNFFFPFPNLAQRYGVALNQVSTPKVLSHSRIMWKIIKRVIHVYSLHFVQSGSYSIRSGPWFSECAETLNNLSFLVKSQVISDIVNILAWNMYISSLCFWVESAVTLNRICMSMVIGFIWNPVLNLNFFPFKIILLLL